MNGCKGENEMTYTDQTCIRLDCSHPRDDHVCVGKGDIGQCRRCRCPGFTVERQCRCYVRRLSREERFSLRSGAHVVSCPAYQVSRDPVDAMHDAEARAHLGRVGVCPFCEESNIPALIVLE